MLEVELREQLSLGRPVSLQTGSGSNDDLSSSESWETDRRVPADLVVSILTSPVRPDAARRTLDLTGARIIGTIELQSALITRSLFLRSCAIPEGIILSDAEIPALALPGSQVHGINAARMICHGSMDITDGFICHGSVELSGAHMASLHCSDATLINPDGIALNGHNCTVDRSVYLLNKFSADGAVNFYGATIGGALDCTGATLRNPQGEALSGYAMTVAQFVYFNDQFTAEGKVSLIGARIGGSLECNGATFTNPGGVAIYADNLTVEQNMDFSEGFTAYGEVRLWGVKIGATLDCTGGVFRNPNGTAILARNLSVGHVIYLNDGFVADGEVSLFGAHIGLTLDCANGVFHNPKGTALDLEHARIEAEVRMRPAEFDGLLNLASCNVSQWLDSRRTWPEYLRLHDFQYRTLIGDQPITVDQRLSWLHRDPDGYHPQPYEQLAKSYQSEGDDRTSRRILIAKQRHRRRRPPFTPTWRRLVAELWSTILRFTIGYGYQPALAIAPASALFLAGCLVFQHDYSQGRLIPVEREAPYPSFSSVRFTTDLLLPVVQLGERANFVAVGSTQWHIFVFTLAGWAVALALVAGAAGVFKRD